jgi:hypothetical protein
MAPHQATPGRRRRFVWRPVLVGGVAAALVATIAVASGLGRSGDRQAPDGHTTGGPAIRFANAALDIQQSGKVYTVRVKNAFADPKEYAGEFRKAGLTVSLTIVPVSPSEEGHLLTFDTGDPPKGTPDGGNTSVDDYPISCPLVGGECPLGLRISTDRPAIPIEVLLGRKARPGETYDSRGGQADATGRGEVLQGDHVEGRSLRDLARCWQRAG